MIDEKSRRKECFDERNSVPIVLADGETWHFPKPWLEIHPTFREGKATSTCPILTYNNEIDCLIKKIQETDDNSTTLLYINSLGALLLSYNYSLSDTDLTSLFVFRLGDRSSQEWTIKIMEVATGLSGPKVSSDGEN